MRFFVTLVTWGTLVFEFALSSALFIDNKKAKLVLFFLGVSFHFFIFVNHGLATFFLAMTSALVLYLVPNQWNLLTIKKNKKMSKDVVSVLVFDFIIAIIPILMYLYPPKDINALIGYRTKRSMENMDNWVFSQKYIAKRWMIVPVIVVVTQLILFISTDMNIDDDPPLIIIVSISEYIIGTFFCMMDTEMQLEKRKK